MSTIQGNNGPFIGELTPPGDKSISHRAVILSSLANGKSGITGFLDSEDTLSTLNAFKNLGIEIRSDKEELFIRGKGLKGLTQPSKIIDAGNSGTTARLLLGLLSGQVFNSEITGDRYLIKRPMGRVVKPLGIMGAQIMGENGSENLPLRINGQQLRGISYKLPVASAQVKSALILAGLYAEGTTELIEPQKTRDHTERMLNHFGVAIDTNENTVKFTGNGDYKAAELLIPSDISSAAFFIVCALINKGSELLIKNVGLNSLRTGVIDILIKMGGDINLLDQREECGEPVGDLLIKSSELKGVDISGDLIPKAIDELPVIAVASCFAEGKTTISEAGELRVKETDRIKAMTTELQKLGANITELENGMVIEGSEELKGAVCESWGDHRVAMSVAVAATRAGGETTINDSDCVNISYPEFFNSIEKLRA
ncbi:MAG: 3-phosphoshikimate 1-carboxyvinyltransferase [Thermodesulfobacteriota bacterium]